MTRVAVLPSGCAEPSQRQQQYDEHTTQGMFLTCSTSKATSAATISAWTYSGVTSMHDCNRWRKCMAFDHGVHKSDHFRMTQQCATSHRTCAAWVGRTSAAASRKAAAAAAKGGLCRARRCCGQRQHDGFPPLQLADVVQQRLREQPTQVSSKSPVHVT